MAAKQRGIGRGLTLPGVIEIAAVLSGRGSVCRAILATLPEWFGIPEALDGYVRGVESSRMLAARVGSADPVGFLALKSHFPTTSEVFVIGVQGDRRGQGIGRALLAAAERELIDDGVRHLTVKTLSADHPDTYYAQTRRFYEAVGFELLEVFPSLWPGDNPCLMLVKRLCKSP